MRRMAQWAALLAAVSASTLGWASLGAAPPQLDPTATRAPAGCDPLPSHDERDGGRRVRDVIPPGAAATAVDHAARGGIDVPGALRDFRELVAGYTTVAAVELPSTGMIVDVRSDGPIQVDATALDALAIAPLMLHHRFDDPRLSSLAVCYERRIVHQRELAGSRLRVYVPSDPRACFRAGRLTADPVGDGVRWCDASGITLPALSGPVRLFGMEVARLRTESSIIVAPGVANRRQAQPIVALELAHELVHHYDNVMGLPPWVSSLRHYEQRAYYIENRLREWYAAPDQELPLPIRYVAHQAGSPKAASDRT